MAHDGTETYQNYINGQWRNASSGRTFDNINPANTDEVIGQFQQSAPEDVMEAVAAAQAAFPKWRATPPAARAEALHHAWTLLAKRQDDWARDLTRENGKTVAESKAEIVSAHKEMAYQIAEGMRLCGRTVASEKDGVFSYSKREPLGVVAVITPWNFPFNVVCRKAIPALMAGNTVVFKPASFTPLTGLRYTQLLDEAGLPPGVFNMVTGQGGEIGDTLVEHPDVKAVSFTGSTAVGRSIERKAIAHGAKAQMEMGGKNPVVVLEDADMDQAVQAILLAAYACAGQWCTSTSRVIVMEAIADELTHRLVEGAKQIKLGCGLHPQTTMGPVAGDSQLRTVLEYIRTGKQEGATLLIGGERYVANGCDKGTFITPTLFTDVKPHMRIAQEEIFGPVLSILVARDFDEAIEIANGVPFGLSSSIFTNDLKRTMTFLENTHVGLTHVNMPTAYKEVALEFGGIKDSGSGSPESGHEGIEFFTQHKVAYIKYR